LFSAGFDQARVEKRAELQGDGSEGYVGHSAVDGPGGLFFVPDKAEDFAAAR
jgi:hypothetical protein